MELDIDLDLGIRARARTPPILVLWHWCPACVWYERRGWMELDLDLGIRARAYPRHTGAVVLPGVRRLEGWMELDLDLDLGIRDSLTRTKVLAEEDIYDKYFPARRVLRSTLSPIHATLFPHLCHCPAYAYDGCMELDIDIDTRLRLSLSLSLKVPPRRGVGRHYMPREMGPSIWSCSTVTEAYV